MAFRNHVSAWCWVPTPAPAGLKPTPGWRGVLSRRGRLHIDILGQKRFLLNQADNRIKSSPSKPEYFLSSPEADTYSIKMISARLETVNVSACIPLCCIAIIFLSITRMRNIPKSRKFLKVTCTSSKKTCTRSKCRAGSSLVSWSWTRTKENVRLPSRALTPNLTTNDYLEAYETLFTGNGKKMTSQNRHHT